MKKDSLSNKEKISVISLFIVGAASVFVSGIEAKQDVRIAYIIVTLLTLPLIFIIFRLYSIFPQKDLFDIIQLCFGNIIGKGIILIIISYLAYWISDLLVTYGLFIMTVSMEETPSLVFILFITFLCIYLVKEGASVLARCSELFIVIVVLTFTIIFLLSIPKMNIDYIMPILSQGLKPVMKGVFSLFTFPFAQIFILSIVIFNFDTKSDCYKIYLKGFLIGVLLLLLLSLTNVLVLGVDSLSTIYFPTYKTIARLNVGSFLQRMEIIIVITFLLGGVFKISLLLLCLCKGIAEIVEIKDYRIPITPVSLLLVNIALALYDNIMEYFEFSEEIWNYYFLPLNLLLPIVVYIAAEIKRGRLVKSKKV